MYAISLKSFQNIPHNSLIITKMEIHIERREAIKKHYALQGGEAAAGRWFWTMGLPACARAEGESRSARAKGF